MTDKTILHIDHAQKYYNRGRGNEIHVMNDVTLSLPESGMVAIFGKSGCGKTTLLNTVGGLDGIASGRIEIFGEDLSHDPDLIRNRYTGYIFQNYNLNVGETVFENVADALRLCGVEDKTVIRTRVMAALADVDMDKYRDRTPDTLSGGQQQRVAIARAIVKSPAIILADEPTGNLDENNTVMVMDILKEISRTRLVLLVTHEANLVDFYCDRVIEMADGHIVGDRVNSGANGYVQRNKNDIFLGDLPSRTDELAGVSLTTYGDLPADTPVRIRLVSERGRMYLVCDTPGVRFLDESSEVHLREGSFQSAGDPTSANRGGKPLDMSALGPIEGKHFGRLYRFPQALSMAWRENYSQRRKKGKRFLRVCLVLLAFVMVFTAASAAVQLRDYIDFKRDYDANLFFVPVNAGKNGADFKYSYNELVGDLTGRYGIDGAIFYPSSPLNARSEVRFRTAGFMTAQAEVFLSAEAYALPRSMLAGAELVCGTDELQSANDILITTAMADDLLKSSDVSYINRYKDLLGLVSSQSDAGVLYSTDMYGAGSDVMRIVGVLRSDEKAYLLADLQAAEKAFIGNMSLLVTPASGQTLYKETLKSGETVVLGADGSFRVGETVTILGKNFAVKEVVRTWYDPDDYLTYVDEVKGEKMLSLQQYCKEQPESGLTEEQLYWQYLFAYFPRYLAEYLRLGAEGRDPALWLYAEQDSMASLYYYLNMTNFKALGLLSMLDGELPEVSLGWEAYSFYERTGTWPRNEDITGRDFEYRWEDEYFRLLDIYGKEAYETYPADMSVVVCDEDYIALAHSVGETDERLGGNMMFSTDTYGGETYYSTYLMLHASDRGAAEEYLRAAFGDDLISRDDMLRLYASDAAEGFVAAGIALAVVLALMCLCVFFIMRSSFMSRVREVGILRAIGVSRKNLLYRFLIETILLTVLTVLLGFLVASAMMTYLSGAVFFNQVFYFPLWLAGGLLTVILAACLLFGLLPAMTLLRRTPSEILSKYDI